MEYIPKYIFTHPILIIPVIIFLILILVYLYTNLLSIFRNNIFSEIPIRKIAVKISKDKFIENIKKVTNVIDRDLDTLNINNFFSLSYLFKNIISYYNQINHKILPSLKESPIPHPDLDKKYFSGNINSDSIKIYFNGDLDKLGHRKYTDLILNIINSQEPNNFNNDFFIADIKSYYFKLIFKETKDGTLLIDIRKKHFHFYLSAFDILYGRFLLLKASAIRPTHTILSLLLGLTFFMILNIFYFKIFELWHLLIYGIYVELIYLIAKDHLLILKQRKFINNLFVEIMERKILNQT